MDWPNLFTTVTRNYSYLLEQLTHYSICYTQYRNFAFTYSSFVAMQRNGVITKSFCESLLLLHFKRVNSHLMRSHWVRLVRAGRAVIGIISLEY